MADTMKPGGDCMTDPKDRMIEGPDEARDEAEQLPAAVTNDVDAGQIQHFVTEIKSAEQQVGEHIIAALQDPRTVAVITTVVVGADAKQRIVSAGLDPEMMGEIQQLLQQAEQKRTEEVPCIGFHCYLKPREDEAEASPKAPEKDADDAAPDDS